MFKKDFKVGYKNLLVIFIIAFLYYIQKFLSFRHGINYEESRDANSYLLFIQGYLPYRDFEWIYGPFSFFVYPFIMKIFGINLVVLRVSYIIFSSLVIPLSFFLARRIMPYPWAGIAAFLSIIFFDVPYYTFNHVFAILGGLASLLMICRFIETGKRFLDLFLAGIFASLSILTKPLMFGVSLFISISIFMLACSKLGIWRDRFKNYLVFVISTACLPLLYFVYFYSQTTLKNIAIAYPYFAKDLAVSADLLYRIRNIFSLLVNRFFGILPLKKIMGISSAADLKVVLVSSFDNFIFALPFILSAIILGIIFGPNKLRGKIKEKIYQDKNIVLLFSIFSVFISLESLALTHVYGKTNTIQVVFVLLAYLLYLGKMIYSRRPIIARAVIGFLLFYLGFLHFIRYPISNINKYRQPLSLDRAKGILVTADEKKIYESLASFLSLRLGEEDKIAVIGYYPNLSFLAKQKDIFTKDLYIFPNLNALFSLPVKTDGERSLIAYIEDKIVSKMKKEKAKIVLTVSGAGSIDYQELSIKLRDYMEKAYVFVKKIGPGDIYGRGEEKYWINLYSLKER